MTRRSVDDARRWTEHGTALVARSLQGLADADLAAPSGLPGWTRGHVVAHLVGNAHGLLNLVAWARTGVETPMYASPEARLVGIETHARDSATALLRAFTASSAALEQGFSQLTPEQWQREVMTAQGRRLPATEIPWLRAREVMVHAVDLGVDVAYADLPDDFLLALVDDAVARRAGVADHPALHLRAGEETWMVPGTLEQSDVEASLPDIAAFITGRGSAFEPRLPAWL